MQCHQFFWHNNWKKKEVMMMIREGDADKLHDRMRRLDSLFCLGRQAVWVSTEQPNTVA
jgi:hypothetical protein